MVKDFRYDGLFEILKASLGRVELCETEWDTRPKQRFIVGKCLDMDGDKRKRIDDWIYTRGP